MASVNKEKNTVVDEKKSHIIVCTEVEFSKIRDCVKTVYEMVSKVPKKFRTPEFYILENIYNTKFKKEDK